MNSEEAQITQSVQCQTLPNDLGVVRHTDPEVTLMKVVV